MRPSFWTRPCRAFAQQHPGTVDSVFLYGTGLGVTTDFPLLFNSTCQRQVEATGLRAEAILGHHNVLGVLGNVTARALFVAELARTSRENNLYGVSLDWEGVIEQRHAAEFHSFLGEMREALNANGTRLTMYTNGEPIYGNWASYFNNTDRLLDGSCYMSESAEHWREACRPVKPQFPDHKDHQVAALLSGREGDKPGRWGYTKAAAVLKARAVVAHNLTEMAMFNLLSMAPFWVPLLQAFRNGTL